MLTIERSKRASILVAPPCSTRTRQTPFGSGRPSQPRNCAYITASFASLTSGCRDLHYPLVSWARAWRSLARLTWGMSRAKPRRARP